MIIIDTNILLELKNVDIFDHLIDFLKYGEPVVLSSTIEELKNIKNKNAKLALDIIASQPIKIIQTSEKSADKAILNIVKPGDAVVTNDKKLIKALKEKNIKVIRLRQRKYLVED